MDVSRIPFVSPERQPEKTISGRSTEQSLVVSRDERITLDKHHSRLPIENTEDNNDYYASRALSPSSESDSDAIPQPQYRYAKRALEFDNIQRLENNNEKRSVCDIRTTEANNTETNLPTSNRQNNQLIDEAAVVERLNTNQGQGRNLVLSPEEITSKRTLNTKQRLNTRALLSRETKRDISKRNNAQRRAAQGKKTSTIGEDLENLAQTILHTTEIDPKVVEKLRLSQNFACHPKLALMYYHLCGINPDAHVFNDESVRGGKDGEITPVNQRLLNCIGPPIGMNEAITCTESAKQRISGCIRACASCGEIQLDEKNLEPSVTFDDLHPCFKLNEEQISEVAEIGKKNPLVIHENINVLMVNTVMYHLNPDLVPDLKNVILCKLCYADPLANGFMSPPFSIAKGHDYGRRGKLPVLNATTLNVVRAVRAYHIDLVIRSNHTTSHAICFPTDGPVECAKILPHISPTHRVHATFLGPLEKWRKTAKRFRQLYMVDIEGGYKWLDFLQNVCHPSYTNVLVDKSKEMFDSLFEETNKIQEEATCSDNSDVINMDDHTIMEDDIAGDMSTDQGFFDLHNNTMQTPDVIHDAIYSTVLQQPTLIGGGINAAIKAISEVITPDDVPIIPVTRSAEPVNEWENNNILFGGVFPHLFMTGKGIPRGSMNKALWRHFFKYYDGRFDDPLFIATGFNQLQRHACIRKTASLKSCKLKQLRNLGELANSMEFKKALLFARDNPLDPKSITLNGKVCRIMSMVGETVPFSPFERASTRPKLVSQRYRYGPGIIFHTMSPPEQDDLQTLRIACLAGINDWNNDNCPISSHTCTIMDLPNNLASNTGARMQLTRLRYGLQALFFEGCLTSMVEDVMQSSITADTRLSRDYLDRQRGVYGSLAAISGVTEPQKGYRLHAHISTYASALTPQLLTRLAAAPDIVRNQVAAVLDSMTCTHVSGTVREWYNTIVLNQETVRPRASEITIPSLSSSTTPQQFRLYLETAQKKQILTGTHKHGCTCTKPPKGKYMCRLCMGRGHHKSPTCPVFVSLTTRPDNKKHTRAQLSGMIINDMSSGLQSETNKIQPIVDTLNIIDQPIDYLNGELMRQHPKGPVIWELQRPAEDTMFVEANLISRNIVDAAQNSQLMTSIDGAEAVEKYKEAYMTKEGAPLRQAASILLAAMEHIEKHPSTADDTGTVLRTGKHLAVRTVNAFSGNNQWAMPICALALLGHKSSITSDVFRYIFPHATVQYRDNSETVAACLDYSTEDDACSKDDSCSSSSDKTEQTVKMPTQRNENVDGNTVPDEVSNDVCLFEDVNTALDTIIDAVDTNVESNDPTGGATIYKINGEHVIFLSQAENYDCRGPHFIDYSILEYESIVELLPTRQHEITSQRGRKSRSRFPLDTRHQLFGHYDAVIRLKFRTPVLAGKPCPPFPCNKPASDDPVRVSSWHKSLIDFAKYVIDLLVPWQSDTPMLFDRSPDGLQKLLHQWDRRSAPLICRQRFLYLRGIMSSLDRNSRNESICSWWRERNADYWAEIQDVPPLYGTKLVLLDEEDIDPEARGILAPSELIELTAAVNKKNDHVRADHKRLIDSCNILFSVSKNVILDNNIATTAWQSVIYDNDHSVQCNGLDLIQIHKGIVALQVAEAVPPVLALANNGCSGPNENNVHDPGSTSNWQIGRHIATDEQNAIVSAMLESKEQQLIKIHGGGVGKLFVIKMIYDNCLAAGRLVPCCCPTGVGAIRLPNGKTFASMWKTFTKEINANKLIETMFNAIGGVRVKCIIVDEDSMLSAEFLVLLDQRLRGMYAAAKIFGGISVMLVGDFLQLPVVTGCDLYRVFYNSQQLSVHINARNLFSQFRVFNLTIQHRAATCRKHCKRLKSLRALPTVYPSGKQWTTADNASYRPVTDDVMEGVTSELTTADIAADPLWATEATCLTTSNSDRAIINGTRAPLFARETNQQVFRWRRTLKNNIPMAIQSSLYDELSYPELFGYFVYDAPGMILDNGNGNVEYGVANGTRCRYKSMAWDSPDDRTNIILSIQKQVENEETIINLAIPPDHIIVSVDGVDVKKWPMHLNLSPPNLVDGSFTEVHIPISLIKRKSYSVRVGPINIYYELCAVDLSFALTTWKSQSAEFSHIVALLEPSHGARRISYELLYTMYSRVKASSKFKCFPLSLTFKKSSLQNLRPNIFATKWRMDIGKDGFWYSRENVIKPEKPATKLQKFKISRIIQPTPQLENLKPILRCQDTNTVRNNETSSLVPLSNNSNSGAFLHGQRRISVIDTKNHDTNVVHHDDSVTVNGTRNFTENAFPNIPSIQLRGLTNTGNTCYLNAALQLLFSIIPIDEALRVLVEPPVHPPTVASLLQQIVFCINQEQDMPWQGATFFTSSLRELLHYPENTQQDAHETILKIFASIADEIWYPVGVEHIYIRTCSMCLSTFESETENITCIQLPVPPDSATVSALIQKYYSSDILPDVFCNICNIRGENTRKTVMTNTKPYIVVLLLRSTSINGVGSKTNTKIDGCLVLNIEQHWYELVAAVVHLGTDVFGGHYQTLRRIANNWYLFDDIAVTLQPDFGTLLRTNSYILLYQKKSLTHIADGILESATTYSSHLPNIEHLGSFSNFNIARLRDQQWLSDEIINTYLLLIQSRSDNNTQGPKIICFNTYFYTKLVPSNNGYSYNEVKRWTTRRTQNIFLQDFIVFPLHVGNNHWCLAVFDMVHHRITYYDSLGGNNPVLFQHARKYLYDEARDKHVFVDLDDWEDIVSPIIPRQTNYVDCGIFTLSYANCVTAGIPMSFSQNDIPQIRRQITVDIISGTISPEKLF